MYFWLYWVFIATQGLPLAVVSRNDSWLWFKGASL